ncbi:MAG: DNA polymerase I [Fimbriiglobus sp.]
METSLFTTETIPSAGNLYVLDSHGLIFQMFHGIGPMSAPDGRPTNAVFGVTRAIMNLYDQEADYLVCAFDRKEATFREDMYKEYKAHRPPPPDDLLVQEPMIQAVLEAMRIPCLSVAGFEADDIMATLASEGVARGLMVQLCTSDKDCRQLLNDRVKIRNLRKGETLDRDGLMKDWGVEPKQVVDFQALVGDSVDNVPGVAGCGPKTAAKWLQEYKTLENLIANADKVGGPKLRDSLKAAIADGSLELSRKLVRLDDRVPMPLEWDNWKRRDWDGQRLLELFTEFGFRGFANKVRSTLMASGASRNRAMLADLGVTKSPTAAVASAAPAPMGATKAPRLPRPGQPTLFDMIDDEGQATPPKLQGDYHIINDATKFENFLRDLHKQARFTIDLETTSLEPHTAEIVGLAFSWKEAEAYYLPLRGPSGSQLLPSAETLARLKPIFENPLISKSNQNIKYDLLVLRAHGITLEGIAGDSMVADYLLHAGERTHNLDELARRYFSHENIAIETLIGRGKNQLRMDQVPIERIAAYAAEDADIAERLTTLLEPQLVEARLKPLYDELEIPLLEVLAEMEYNGVALDTEFLAKLSVEMAGQLESLETVIHELAGVKFNIASPKQLREVLFDQMKLPKQKKTGTTGEASTDQESLERLAALGHELPRKMIEHRQIAKLKGTYVDALPAILNPKTKRLHTSFNQTITSTGRLSSSDPNLQNIPTRTEMGQQIRKAFIAAPGHVLLAADYSQIELRLLAHFCGDANLQRAFAEDRDIHASVAAEIFRVPEAEVQSSQRRAAKTVNFGIIYGISAVGLSTRLSLTRAEAEDFIDSYFERYPRVLHYQDQLLANARQTGFVSTILGRRRHFDPSGIRPKSRYQNRTQAEREAINMEIQGSAADLMKKAMLAVHRRMQAEGSPAKMLLSVHDELVFEVPPEGVASLAKLVREEMVGAMKLDVPLRVDVVVGANWLDAEDYAG